MNPWLAVTKRMFPTWTDTECEEFEVQIKKAGEDLARSLVSYIRHDREMDAHMEAL